MKSRLLLTLVGIPLLLACRPAHAATLITDIFALPTATTTSVVVNGGSLSSTTNSGFLVNTGLGTLTGSITAGPLDTTTVSLTTPVSGSSTLSIANSLVALGSSFSLADSFSSIQLIGGDQYSLSFNVSGTGLGLLSSFNVSVYAGTSATGTALASSSFQSLLGLPGTQTATLNFALPAGTPRHRRHGCFSPGRPRPSVAGTVSLTAEAWRRRPSLPPGSCSASARWGRRFRLRSRPQAA